MAEMTSLPVATQTTMQTRSGVDNLDNLDVIEHIRYLFPPCIAPKGKPVLLRNVRFFVFSHGWLGDRNWLEYLRSQVSEESIPAVSEVVSEVVSDDTKIITYCAMSNEKKTGDGVIMGGTRLAAEITELIDYNISLLRSDRSIDQHTVVSLSYIGFSLGGLYGRYAVYELFRNRLGPNRLGPNRLGPNRLGPNRLGGDQIRIQGYNVVLDKFVTIATPHLGIASHTYIKIPRIAETAIGKIIGRTGDDLARTTDLITRMSTSDEFLQPLSRFNQRFLLSNSFETDLLVPHASAMFLNDNSDILQHNLIVHLEKDIREQSMVAGVVRTNRTFADPDPSATDPSATDPSAVEGSVAANTGINEENEQCSRRMDSLGWTKYIIDVRKTLTKIHGFGPTVCDGERDGTIELEDIQKNPHFTSGQLNRVLFQSCLGRREPSGHLMIIGSDPMLSSTYYDAGRPIMDFLARLLVGSGPGIVGRS